MLGYFIEGEDLMLLEQGYGTQEANWFVDEKKGPGFCRVYYLESGIVFFHDEAGLQQLTPETLYIFPSHAPFSIRHRPSHPICCLWYHLNLFPIMVTSLIKIAVPPDGELFHLIAAFRCAIQNPATTAETLRYLADALTSFFNEEKLLPQPAAAEWTDYLQTHACENEAIYQIANRFGYTAEHFIRQFHEKTGMSPCQYRIHCRLNHAIGRLAAGASISDIAQELGYAESKSFSRAFRTHYGVSPQEYRKRRHTQP